MAVILFSLYENNCFKINKILRESFFWLITVSLIAKYCTSESVLHQIDGAKIEIYYKLLPPYCKDKDTPQA